MITHVTNFPLSYGLAWVPRFLHPSRGGDRSGFTRPAGRLCSPERAVRIVFVGDVSAIANRDAPEIHPDLQAVLSSADLVVANCESPIITSTSHPLLTKMGQLHGMSPDFVRGVLAAMNVDPNKLVVTLANNHALDQDPDGFEQTLATLDAMGIRVFGTVERPECVVSTDGVDIAFFAFTEWRNSSADVFEGRVVMTDRLTDAGWRQVRDLHADLVCAVPHWDWEFCHFPRARTRALARELVANGVGLVVATHAHVVQPVGRIDDTVVAYSLGDFLGTAAPRQRWTNRISAMLSVEVSADPSSKGQVASYEIVPFVRIKESRHERLVPVASLDDKSRTRVQRRLTEVLG